MAQNEKVKPKLAKLECFTNLLFLRRSLKKHFTVFFYFKAFFVIFIRTKESTNSFGSLTVINIGAAI